MTSHGLKIQQKRRNPTSKWSSGNDASDNDDDNASPIVKLFRSYQLELDTKYDKYERLLKRSRDLTIESKRIIFLLHRITGEEDREATLLEAETRLSKLFYEIINGIGSELTKPEVFQYIRAFSPGLQEYVEALSFYHYLKNGNLVSIEEIYHPCFVIKSEMNTANNEVVIHPNKERLPMSVILTPMDFVLGIADLTGELMRKCINSVGCGNIDEPFKLCCVLQNIYDAFLVINNHSKRDLKRKIITLKSSLQKVENACYAIKIRGSEKPKHMMTDFFSTEDCYNENNECDI